MKSELEDKNFKTPKPYNEAEDEKRILYVAKKGDAIDIQVANFINNYPDQEFIDNKFIREYEGMYRFGAKRIQIKIERGDKILIRVGGGHINIKEYIAKQ